MTYTHHHPVPFIRNTFTILLLAVALASVVCGCSGHEGSEGPHSISSEGRSNANEAEVEFETIRRGRIDKIYILEYPCGVIYDKNSKNPPFIRLDRKIDFTKQMVIYYTEGLSEIPTVNPWKRVVLEIEVKITRIVNTFSHSLYLSDGWGKLF